MVNDFVVFNRYRFPNSATIMEFLKLYLPKFYLEILNCWNDFEMHDNVGIEAKILKKDYRSMIIFRCQTAAL